jgi:hypothetical protein
MPPLLPIEIINRILVCAGELNGHLVIPQYDPDTTQEYYKINLYSNSLWRIKSTLVMKKIYPIYTHHLNGDYSNEYDGFKNKYTIELYKFGIPHYEDELRRNIHD